MNVLVPTYGRLQRRDRSLKIFGFNSKRNKIIVSTTSQDTSVPTIRTQKHNAEAQHRYVTYSTLILEYLKFDFE